MLPNISPAFLDADIKRKSAVLIASTAEGDARCGLVFEFDHFAFRGSGVGSEGHKQITRHALLDCYTRAGILLVSAQDRIDGELRNACDLLDPAGDLAAHAGCNQGFRAEV